MKNEKGSAGSMFIATILSSIFLAIALAGKYVLLPAAKGMFRAMTWMIVMIIRGIKALVIATKKNRMKKSEYALRERQLEFNTDSMPTPYKYQ